MTASLINNIINTDQLELDIFKDQGFDLYDLLTHSSGIPNEYNQEIWHDIFQSSKSPPELRCQVLKYWTSQNIKSQSGFCYSNWNYILLAAIIESHLKHPFENLMTNYLNNMGMKDFSFARPTDSKTVGHYLDKQTLVAATPEIDNPAFFTPAGRIRLTLKDWSLFLDDQLNAIKLTAPSAQMPGSSNAKYTSQGWIRTKVKQTDIHTHNGSNTLWYPTATVIPQKNSYWMIVANSATPDTIQTIDQWNQSLVHIQTT